jgi:YEATS domain-containing protein 1/3
VIKEPPYQVSESGYAGFLIPVEIYFKQKEEPKKISFNYDLILLMEENQQTTYRLEKVTIQNPSDEFREKLLRGGGVSNSQ